MLTMSVCSYCSSRAMRYLALEILCIPGNVRRCLIWLEPVKDVEPYVVGKFEGTNSVRIPSSSQ